ENVSTEGGYLWQYSEDLEKREGEGKASKTMPWVQPPGTPSVGGAFLDAYEATGEPYYLEVAKQTAMALVRGQLLSGGWDYRIEFDPEKRKSYAYRVDNNREASRNTSTLDDNTTQSALRFLMRVDQTLDLKNEAIHDAVVYSLKHLLDAQYPNGAWPQRFDSSPDPQKHPVMKASYPETWSRTHPDQDYRSYYTFNDNTISDMVRVMLDAHEIYGDPKYLESAEKAGDFVLLAQMPEPQPAWAQQYDVEMHPAWARKFEPPAVTGGESRGAIQTLLMVYEATGKEKYLEPIPKALDYFEISRLPNGELARFYELKTNRPLFFTKNYQLTYDDSDMPTHYSFKQGYWVDSVRAEYERVKSHKPEDSKEAKEDPTQARVSDLEEKARGVLDRLDDQGRWVEDSRLRYHGDEDPTRRILSSRTFVANVGILCDYLETFKSTQDGNKNP
ncbi:MAG: hypothetical protein KC940_19490, partial [Candidatus Omnitrophica bacterium]|nr:hypothetical protein [Candidatus Omnitrophota bacterium]